MTHSYERRLAVVVVNFGSHKLLATNLGPVPDAAHVIVVDNYHSDGERSAITQLCRDRGWQLVEQRVNQGFGAGCNAGMRAAQAAGCSAVLLLNPDARLSADVIEQLGEQVHREPRTVVTPCLDDSSGRRVYQGVELRLRDGRMVRSDPSAAADASRRLWLSGAALALHVDVFALTGGFDEEYFLYWEDVDLSIRAADAGCRLVVRPDLVGLHDEGGTHAPAAQQRAKSAIYYYYNCRNRLYFAARHVPRRQLLRWLVATPGASWEILMRGGRRQLLHSPGLGLAALRGTIAGTVVAVAALRGRGRLAASTGPHLPTPPAGVRRG